MKFVDLFAGLGGFHVALERLGHECVFASEIDAELRDLYALNFPRSAGRVFGDIRKVRSRVPRHDILAAGFPCQPFSKSGRQDGLEDRTRGTLFHEIRKILKVHQPRFVILENVGNFERHDRGNTWEVVSESLEKLGYNVRGTTHVASGGHGLISPHHLGYPQTRERFFIVASTDPLPKDPFPQPSRARVTSLAELVEGRQSLSKQDTEETKLTEQQGKCINHWNQFVQAIPTETPLPSFPIWGDEFGAKYPFVSTTPAMSTVHSLRWTIPHEQFRPNPRKKQLLSLLPAYARRTGGRFPDWKVRFIRQNRDYYPEVRGYLPVGWREALDGFPASLRKLEWNCNGEKRDLWQCVLQFRPSGLRAKRYTSVPALVAMTTTQIPILGPERRFLTRGEGLRLQGFADAHRLPRSRQDAFAALGNAVHTGVVLDIAHRLLNGKPHELELAASSNAEEADAQVRTAGR